VGPEEIRKSIIFRGWPRWWVDPSQQIGLPIAEVWQVEIFMPLSLSFHLRPMSSDATSKITYPLKDLVAVSVADSSVSSETKLDEKVAGGQVGQAGSLKV
jgi:hypothetical protein